MKTTKNKQGAKKRAAVVQVSEKDLVAVVGGAGALKLPLISKLSTLK